MIESKNEASRNLEKALQALEQGENTKFDIDISIQEGEFKELG